MKRKIAVLAALSLAIASWMLITGFFWGKPKAKKTPAPEPDTKKQLEKQAEKEADKQANILNEARRALVSREWTVYLKSPKKGDKRSNKGSIEELKEEIDTLTFTDYRVKSKNLASEGYSESGSNYSLNIMGGDVPFWETMQRDESGNIAFLRGELRGEVMGGSIIIRPKKGEDVIYYFSSEEPEKE